MKPHCNNCIWNENSCNCGSIWLYTLKSVGKTDILRQGYNLMDSSFQHIQWFKCIGWQNPNKDISAVLLMSRLDDIITDMLVFISVLALLGCQNQNRESSAVLLMSRLDDIITNMWVFISVLALLGCQNQNRDSSAVLLMSRLDVIITNMNSNMSIMMSSNLDANWMSTAPRMLSR